MKIMPTASILAIVMTLAPTSSFANGLTAVKPAPGLACMSLDSQAMQATQQSDLPAVLAAPSPTATHLGYPTEIVFVTWPLVERNGYVQMERINGQVGWIAANRLQPWHPLNGGNAKCVPSIMSNGRLGTSIH
jgi:hypothetical protein